MPGAEGVPDVQQPAVLRADDDDVSLVRRRVADVAAGRGDHVTAVEVERGGDLLELRQLRDRSAPDGMAGRDRQLLDPPVGRGGVDPLAAGIGNRSRRRDLRRAGPAGVTRRCPAPEDVPARCVDCERDPVGGRDEERVVGRPVDGNAVQVDRGGVDRAGQVNLLASQRADVRRRDPGRMRVVVAAACVPAEARPVAARGRDGLTGTGDAGGRPAATTAGSENGPRDEDQDQRQSKTRRDSFSLPGSEDCAHA